MLEKPDLHDESIIVCLRNEYGLHIDNITFLPLGADRNTAVYRAVADDRQAYFCKLRRGVFDETSVMLPKHLSDQGIAEIVPPLATTSGQLWASVDAYTSILYRYVEGHDGYAKALTGHQWREFGSAVKRIHSAVVPDALTRRIARETYPREARETLKVVLRSLSERAFDNAVAADLATLLRTRSDQILDLVARSERLARALQLRAGEFTLCHSDIHAGNILIDGGGALYIVDWDNPILAPKERDLMFVGGAQGFVGRTAEEEEALFYEGYGPASIDPVALAYYRYERIVQDIAVYCDQIFTTDGDADREQSLRHLASNFSPNGTLEMAYRSEDRGV